jgi:hypothetical protein
MKIKLSIFRNEVLWGQVLFNLNILRFYIHIVFPLHGLKHSNIKLGKRNSNSVLK